MSEWSSLCGKNDLFTHGLGVMVFNATFKNISVISWRSLLLVEEPEYQEKYLLIQNVYNLSFK